MLSRGGYSELRLPEKYVEQWSFGLYLGVWAMIFPSFGLQV